MSDPIVYVDRSDIRSGKLSELRQAMTALAEFVEANEPQLLSYGFFIDEQASQMTVIAIPPDAASMEFHMEIGASRFRKFADLLQLRSIDVYGQPSEKVLEQLHKKAEMLGEGGGLVVHHLHAGFMRFGAAATDVVT